MFTYLDNSATTRPYDQVTELVAKTMSEDFGNPSSLHRLGMAAEKMVKEARANVAASLGASPEEIFFTSGGTEGDNTAIFGAVNARRHQGNKIITTSVEHPAVLEAFKECKRQGYETVLLDVDRHGFVDLEQLKRELDETTVFVSIMMVNNELGSVQPLMEAAELIREANAKYGKNILFHTDAVQAWGKEEIDVRKLPVDMLSVSGHKIHGPKGIGALYVRKGVNIPSFIFGGGQEKGFRSGTENVPFIVGLGLAAKLAEEERKNRLDHLKAMRKKLLIGIETTIENAVINSPREDNASPAILNVSFPGCRGEVLLHMLEQKDIYVSTGSACSSHKKGSHVLTAAGLRPEEIEGALRLSLSCDITEEQVDYALKELKAAVDSMRRLTKMMGRGKKR
ncbi:MAG: cysteine desulfurase [Firmicutes bacterium]|nr:cysteine desulfurase [Bacillota bacterium]